MATEDISRWATDYRKRYSGVRMQQGRVITDDDWNESERLDDELARRALADVIGPHGTPDDGFRISAAPPAGNGIDFLIGEGTYYIGGLRLETPGERFQLQQDWLNQASADRPDVPAQAARRDLVYLEAWEQPVTAVEDSELLEVALGVDTSVRMKTMHRVRVFTGIGNRDCSDGFEQLLESLAENGEGTLSSENELVPDTTLTVTFEPGGDPDDLCTPLVAGGYLGAANQAVRVELVDSGHFTWGFDNAAPPYRVVVATNDANQRRVIRFQTEPRDQAHWPLAGQVVELLPWSALLPNREKTAEIRGQLFRVASSFNPETGEIALASDVPAGFGEEWTAREDADQLGQAFLYLRVWNRGADRTSDLAIPFTPGTPVTLGTTGLHVTFNGNDYSPGRHWIVAARPETPTTVVPWQLEDGAPPHGYRRFIAPLAVVDWSASARIPATIRDCRRRFRPLTQLAGCCTYTVGDGQRSHGDFTSIQQAVDNLPSNGGEICILPGRYREHVSVQGRRNVRIHGCGLATEWSGQPETQDPLLTLEDCREFEVTRLSMSATEGDAIRLRSTRGENLREITISRLRIAIRDACAVRCDSGRGIRILENQVIATGLLANLSAAFFGGRFPSIFLAADDVLIEGNHIASSARERRRNPFGGIQIAGGSENVEIRRNLIEGGSGNGITLGSVLWVRRDQIRLLETDFLSVVSAALFIPIGGFVIVTEDDCPRFDPLPPGPDDPDGEGPLFPVSAGDLEDIRIIDNVIRDMGSNGIAVARFFADDADSIAIKGLRIEGNTIEGCLRLELSQLPENMVERMAYGAIALAEVTGLVARHNVLRNNGRSHLEPVCGIFVLFAETAIIDENRILDNGPRVQTEDRPRAGLRGGIVVAMAIPSGSSQNFGGAGATRHFGEPALRVHGNTVVSQEGRALRAAAIGPVTVAGNQFTCLGADGVHLPTLLANRRNTPSYAFDLLGGAAVAIWNLGTSVELANPTGKVAAMHLSASAPGTNVVSEEDTSAAPALNGFLAGGNILFHGNQVLLSLLNAGITMPMSATLLLSPDDVCAADNQFDCEYDLDVMLFNGLMAGSTIRVSDNRFKERALRVLRSAFTYGVLNATTGNQSTHCLSVVGRPNLTVNEHNRAWIQFADTGDRDTCRDRNQGLSGMYQKYGRVSTEAVG